MFYRETLLFYKSLQSKTFNKVSKNAQDGKLRVLFGIESSLNKFKWNFNLFFKK